MTADPCFPIVGIGSSAGGIEALEGLFRPMPADSGMAFVVVAHLAADRESMLPEILGHFTSMPAAPAEDGEAVQPERIYVIPPNAILTMEGGRLRVLRPDSPRRERNPIDIFFSSLAQDQGERAIGIVLSGGGSDGTLGIKAIKEQGGLTLAQGSDHSVPRHTGMPSSAIATGLVDLVVPVEAMAEKLLTLVRNFHGFDGLAVTARPPEANPALAAARTEICTILRNQTGHDFSGYKDKTFLRRVLRRMQVLQMPGVTDYVAHLRRTSDEVNQLFRDLLIGVTNFFRDREAFEALSSLVIPHLFEGKGAGDLVRVWVPGCATGEEAYSLAILLRQHMDGLTAVPRVQVFATDIDEAALGVARAGRYPAALLADVPAERIKRFFVAEGTSYTLAKPVRDLCIFSAHSVVRDPPFSRIDLVSCRNLLIYLNTTLQGQVIPVFHYALRPGGFLFLGGAENVSQHGDLFTAIDKKHRVFQRRDHVTSPIHFPLFIPGLRFPKSENDPRQDHGAEGLALRRTVESRVLERFAPAHVVVNREGDIVHYSPRTGKYLEPAAGQPSRQLLAMARKGLRLDLRNALHEAVETRHTVVRERVSIEIEDRIQTVDLTVEPLSDQASDPLFLVLFSDVGPPLSPEQAAGRERSRNDGDAAIDNLERELRDTREQLQSTIEEYESSLEELKSANEELVSVNEEMQSANEELETSKEEIQSVNEELHTVNQELNIKVEELARANGDLRNLFESTRIATIFLDQDLVIRSFTPAATAIFNLIPSDRGRPLTDIACHLRNVDLKGTIQTVLETRALRELRANPDNGQAHYLMRVLPYWKADDTMDGVVVTFIDITSVVEAEVHQRTLVDELNHRVRNMLTVVTALAQQTLRRSASPSDFARAFLGRIEALAKAYSLLARDEWSDVPLADVVREELKPYGVNGDDHTRIDGPPVLLAPKAALALGMVIHELATNAVKYGALSTPEGSVKVGWAVENPEGRPSLILRWREFGGPAVTAPARKGFGSELIGRELSYELGGQADIEFRADGVQAALVVPLDSQLLIIPANEKETASQRETPLQQETAQ